MILTFFAAAAANLSETFLTSCTPCCPAAGGVFFRGTAGSMFQRVIYGEGTIRVPWLKRVVHCARERVCASPPSLWISLRATFLPPRTRPSFCMSLRTSAHTGVAIRIPAGKGGRPAAVEANSLHFSVFALGTALCHVLPQGVRIATSLRSSQ